MCLLLGIMSLIPAATALGQTPPQRPDAGDVAAAFFALADWVDAFELPDVGSEDARLPIAGATGTCIVLRKNGRALGIGVDVAGDDLSIFRAATQAMGQVLASVPGDEVTQRDTMLDLMKGSILIELEIAGARTVLLGASYGLACERLNPGLEGLAMRRSQDVSLLFPAQLRVSDSLDRIASVAPSLAGDLQLPLLDLPQLRQRADVALYRFPVVTLTQTEVGGPPRPLFRGETLIANSEVTPERIAVAARDLARHLISTVWPDPPAIGGVEAMQRPPLGVMGDYQPVSDRHEPMFAPPLEQALAALALSRYARLAPPGEEAGMASAAAARRIVLDLTETEDREIDPTESPISSAAICLACLDDGPPIDEPVRELVRAAARRVEAALDPARAFEVYHDARGNEIPLPAHAQALLTAALCRLVREGQTDLTASAARTALHQLWQGVPPEQWLNMLPWVYWAESDLAAITGQPTSHVREMRALLPALADRQITEVDHPSLPDLHGGYALTGGPVTSATAQTARITCFLAEVVDDSAVVPAQSRDAELSRHLAAIRFLMQLQVRPDSAWRYTQHGRVLGGIRQATWAATQPTAAQALTLITLAETVRLLSGGSDG